MCHAFRGRFNKDSNVDILVNALNESTGNADQVLFNDGAGRFASMQSLLPASSRHVSYDPSLTATASRTPVDGMSASSSRAYLNDGASKFILRLERQARGFAASQEFTDLYGAVPTKLEVATRLHENVLRLPG